MKKQFSYYRIKWTAFFLTTAILGIGLIGLWFSGKKPAEKAIDEKETEKSIIIEDSAGYYSNEAFSLLLENNLAELGFLSEIAFIGKDEGHFSISGTLSEPTRLAAICQDLKPYEPLLHALKDETITIQGHLGIAEDGNARIIADTLTFSNHTVSAGSITDYIEQYTAVNDLFNVPFNQVCVNREGVTFFTP